MVEKKSEITARSAARKNFVFVQKTSIFEYKDISYLVRTIIIIQTEYPRAKLAPSQNHPGGSKVAPSGSRVAPGGSGPSGGSRGKILTLP